MKKPGLGAITTSTTDSSTSCSTAPQARSGRLCGSTKFFSWTAAGAGTKAAVGSSAFLLLVLLHRLAGEPERLDARRHAAVHRHLKQHLADLLARAAVGERAFDVRLEFVRAVER